MTKLKVRKNGAWEWMQTGLTPLASVPGVSLQAIDGGSSFYANKGYSVAAVPLDNPSFFPIGVWYEGVMTQSDVDIDKDTGLNTYVMLTPESDATLIRSNGMYAITDNRLANYGSETIGYILSDETDMQYPAGWGSGQGYAIQQAQADSMPQGDGRVFYANYGKGILLRTWRGYDVYETFLNNFQQTVSDDFYWYTDHDISAVTGADPYNQAAQFYDMYSRDFTKDEAQRACHYGNVVRHLRQFVNPYRWEPVWGFVENGGPFANNIETEYMDPTFMTAAVWHMIIAGARGIVYFNHTFGGPQQSQHNFRMPYYAPVQAAAKAVNGRVQGLASVINSPFAIDFATVTPAPTIFDGIEHMVKYSGGKFYIFAGSRASRNASTPTTAQFTIPTGVGATATVLDEGRSIPIVNGTFSDSFANGNSIHIYRIDA